MDIELYKFKIMAGAAVLLAFVLLFRALMETPGSQDKKAKGITLMALSLNEMGYLIVVVMMMLTIVGQGSPEMVYVPSHEDLLLADKILGLGVIVSVLIKTKLTLPVFQKPEIDQSTFQAMVIKLAVLTSISTLALCATLILLVVSDFNTLLEL